MLPAGQYLLIESEAPIHCTECDYCGHDIVLSNEIFIRDEDNDFMFRIPKSTWGIEAVVRFMLCGHKVQGAWADPRTVAYMLERYEAMDDDGD